MKLLIRFQGQWISVLRVTSRKGLVDGTVYPPAEPGHSCVDSWKPGILADVSPGGEPIKSSVTHKQLSRIPLRTSEHTHSIVALFAFSTSVFLRTKDYHYKWIIIREG